MLPARVSSIRPMTATSELSLMSTTRKPMPGGTMMRAACGITTNRSCFGQERPSACAASN